jgi:hypothetical protein
MQVLDAKRSRIASHNPGRSHRPHDPRQQQQRVLQNTSKLTAVTYRGSTMLRVTAAPNSRRDEMVRSRNRTQRCSRGPNSREFEYHPGARPR